MLSLLRKSNLAAKIMLMVFAFSLIGAGPLPAQERYPAVARLSFISGPVTYSRGDDPDEWDDAIENVPLTIGDRIYAPEGGRAELQLSSGNFVRLGPRSYLSTLNLSDDIKQFYLGEGAASFNIRRLPSDEVIEVDTPNASVTFEEPGQYRLVVDEDGNSRIAVRRGRATVAASGRQIAVENSEIRIFGIDSPRYEIVGLPTTDAFDRWVSERDGRYERSYTEAYRYASDDIIGAEDLAEYGRWEEIPEYGYAWTPSRVAAGWAPFSNGRWYWQDPWGWSWISNERWGWATSHYGRWTPYRSRWYWVPVRPRTRVRYAPAIVEFVRVRDHVGWFPLHPRDRHVPWWERRDRRFDRNVTYVNRTYVTVVNQNTFITARPVNRYIVRDSVIIRDARSARFTESLPIPNRSSIRIVSENGGRRGHRPSTTVLNRTAVIRTALPNPPRAFQEKLPEIQKNQGKAVEPAKMLASRDDDRGTARVRVRPAVEARGGDFAPRNPSVSAGPALQPVTEARGKKLATRENTASERTERAQKAPDAQAQPQAEPSKGTASRSEPPRQEQNRERQQDNTQDLERQQQAQQKEEERKAQVQKQQQERERQQQAQERQAQDKKQRELERRQAQQKEEDRKAPAQKQPAQERRQEPQERQSAQQRLEELERREARQREAERKSHLQQNRQEQERREQLRQQQERQAQQRQQQQQQQEQERKAQAQQQQQEQARREQLRQQQLQERQTREQQRQQDAVRRQQQQQREQAELQQRQEQARAQQLRQQQAQAQREAQQAQRQQEQERRPARRQPPQPQEQPVPQPQAPRQPGQF